MRFPLSCVGLLRRSGLGLRFDLGPLWSVCRGGPCVVWLVAVALLLLGRDWWCAGVVELR